MSYGLTVLQGDAAAMLRTLPENSVQCCVTSPPYWGLRDYGVEGQIGLEKTPELFIAAMVDVFAEVRRVLRKDGTCWMNLGDSYANDGKWGGSSGGKHVEALHGNTGIGRQKVNTGLKPKDLVGMPWRVAFALQSDGWYLRSDIIWSKPNPMPESVTDRPTKSHEYLFLLTKSDRYYYDAEAIKEPVTGNAHGRGSGVNPKCAGWAAGPGSHSVLKHAKSGGSYKGKTPGRNSRVNTSRTGNDPQPRQNESFSAAVKGLVDSRNKRSVWTVPTYAFPEAHFATYPPDLIRPCILAGSKPGDAVLDPFGGSGTTGAVALELGRFAIMIELNPEYADMIRRRCRMTPGLAL
jgi:DNA modification methylase